MSVNIERTRHHWCSLRNILKGGVVHLPQLEVSHLLLLVLLARLLALLRWHWAVTGEVSRLPTVVTREQIGAHPRLLRPDLLLILLRGRRPDCTRQSRCGALLEDPAAGAVLFFSAL